MLRNESFTSLGIRTEGEIVTLKCRMRRQSCDMINSTYSTRNVAVGTRISPHVYNTPGDIDRALEILDSFADRLRVSHGRVIRRPPPTDAGSTRSPDVCP